VRAFRHAGVRGADAPAVAALALPSATYPRRVLRHPGPAAIIGRTPARRRIWGTGVAEAKQTAGWAAAALARAQRAGVLATLSRRHAGHPFGSVVPYVVLADGRLAIYISDLAEHTRNLDADPRAALTVFDPRDLETDPQAGARLTLMVRTARVSGEDLVSVSRRYEAYVPKAARYRAAHDFAYYAVSTERARYIGGFGDIHWLAPAELPLAHPYADEEPGILRHMNDDHADALVRYWRAAAGTEPPEPPVLLGLDPCGMDLRAGGRLVRVPFPAPVRTAGEVRAAVVALTRRTEG
jgi:heme iron utilization protein